MTSSGQPAFEAAIIDACISHRKAHRRNVDYHAVLSIGTDFSIKYDNPERLWPEIATMLYVSKYAESQANAPRIPKIIHYFQDQMDMYLVMEYITLTDSPAQLSERKAEVSRWLSTVPIPPGHAIGPLGNGLIRHCFFKEDEAPIRFSSVEALERYVEKARRVLAKPARKLFFPSVKISHERLFFCQPDMDDSNFGVDEQGRTVLLNFEQIAVLPESFAVFDVSSTDSLSISNGTSMAAISSCLWMVADETFDLDEDGYSKGSKHY